MYKFSFLNQYYILYFHSKKQTLFFHLVLVGSFDLTTILFLGFYEAHIVQNQQGLWTCTECDKEFNMKGNASRHFVTMHIGKILLLPPKYEIIMVPSNHSNFQYCDSQIGLSSIAPCKVITLNPLCILFGISSLLLFWWLSFLSYLSSLLKALAKI